MAKNHHADDGETRWTVDWKTPIGPMRGEVGAEGWYRLSFPDPENQTLGKRARGAATKVRLGGVGRRAGVDALSPRVIQHVESMTGYLEDCFAGRSSRRRPRIAPRPRGEFEARVRECLCEIPWGGTVTYGELARLAGKAGAARAVGGVMARNPLPLVVPCHRVVSQQRGGKRGLGGFGGGLALKRYLLKLEGGGCWSGEDE